MIQIDIEMPKCCDVCMFSEWSNLSQTASCKLKDHEPCFDDFSKEYESKRASFCPLHEVTDSDTISRQDAINLIERYCDNGCEIAEDEWCPDCQQSKFAEMIKALPPSPSRPHGKWVFSTDDAEGTCTICQYKIYGRKYQGHYMIVPYNFCPNCGAEMLTEGEG